MCKRISALVFNLSKSIATYLFRRIAHSLREWRISSGNVNIWYPFFFWFRTVTCSTQDRDSVFPSNEGQPCTCSKKSADTQSNPNSIARFGYAWHMAWRFSRMELLLEVWYGYCTAEVEESENSRFSRLNASRDFVDFDDLQEAELYRLSENWFIGQSAPDWFYGEFSG